MIDWQRIGLYNRPSGWEEDGSDGVYGDVDEFLSSCDTGEQSLLYLLRISAQGESLIQADGAHRSHDHGASTLGGVAPGGGIMITAPVTEPTRREVSAGGYSRTIAGAIKMFIGVALHLILKLTGWALPEMMQSEVIDGLALLVILGLELWGGIEVYAARSSRGDVTVLGKRVADVAVTVAPVATPEHMPPAT